MSGLTGLQIRAARALLRLTSTELAALAGVSPVTVRRAEQEDGQVSMLLATAVAVRSAIENAGVVLIDEEEGITGPGARLKWGVKIPRRAAGEDGAGAR